MAIGTPFPDKVTSVTHTYELETLTASTSASGHFFLGSGTLGSAAEYQYFDKRGGAYYSEKIPSDGVPIFLTKDGSAYVVVTTKTDYANWIFPSFVTFGPTDSYAFHIPAGFIAQNYNITGGKK